MNLLQMSFTGGVLILAVIVLRAMALNRLPKGTFLALWAVAVLRLLVPVQFFSPVGVYTLKGSEPLRTAADAAAASSAAAGDPVVSTIPSVPGPSAGYAAPAASAGLTAAQVWPWVWLAGAAVCGTFFLISYLRCRREFRTALPVEDERLQIWLAVHPLRRRVSIRQSDRIHAPLTYGLLRPVILLPKSMDWADEARLGYVLEHELTHIRRLDALWKLILAFTACVHWFNPLVWCMVVLANRDMELRCDEAVVRRLGLDSRSEYARALISLEEKKSGVGPFASAFSKNAIEERIIAIMKTKKRSLAAILAAVLLAVCVVACAAPSGTSGSAAAAALRGYLDGETMDPQKQAEMRSAMVNALDALDSAFTEEEQAWLRDLKNAGWEGMTVAAYQEKMWGMLDTPEALELVERYSRSGASLGAGFDDYFYNVLEPLTAEKWQERDFSAAASNDRGMLEYNYSISVTDRSTLTVADYLRLKRSVEPGVQNALDDLTEKTPPDREMAQDELDAAMKALFDRLNSIEGVQAHMTANGYIYLAFDDPDAALYAQSSRESAAQWAELLSPYVPFGLTYEFDDPDHDGNGLTMWFQGKEVRGIYDEQEHTWLTEHAGIGFSDGAVELYTVYTDGRLTGLRLATIEEQAGWDEERQKNARALIPLGVATFAVEQREFPRATEEDYDAFLTLRREGYQDESLESFNRRLLDWANENPDAWDRINCDVIWNDYGVNLSTDERIFVSLTCLLSGTENGVMVRALYTGGPAEDPGFSANMPGQIRINEYEEKCVNEWCNLYYNISYHIADKSAVTVSERDACVSGMMNAIDAFWLNTDFDALLQMTEEDIAAQFNVWAGENSTKGVQINPVTAGNIFFEHNIEQGIE